MTLSIRPLSGCVVMVVVLVWLDWQARGRAGCSETRGRLSELGRRERRKGAKSIRTDRLDRPKAEPNSHRNKVLRSLAGNRTRDLPRIGSRAMREAGDFPAMPGSEPGLSALGGRLSNQPQSPE